MKTWRRWCGAMGVACAVAAISGGCSSEMSVEERKQKSKAELAKRHDPIQAKTAAIQALAKITLPAPEERITSPGVRLRRGSDPPAGNLVVLSTEQLPSLVSTPPGVLFADSTMLAPPRWLAGIDQVEAVHPVTVAEYVAAFESLQYVLIVKTNRHVRPVITGSTTFTPGTYVGEAHLYGVDGKRWGGVSFTATSSESVHAADIKKGGEWVQSDFSTRIYDAMKRAVAKHLPDASF